MNNLILVTGGTGYIGSHTTIELLEKGFEVVIIDNLSNSNIEVLDGIEKITGKRPYFEQIDLRDTERVNAFFKQYDQVKAIIHFAASKAVGESVNQPLLYYRNNLLSLMNLLDNMSRQDVPYFVFSSSCTVYGEPDELPVSENAPIKKANSPYGNTKQISEEIIQDTIHADEKIKAISLRYSIPWELIPPLILANYPWGSPKILCLSSHKLLQASGMSLKYLAMITIHPMAQQ